jgi:hypothetical protein
LTVSERLPLRLLLVLVIASFLAFPASAKDPPDIRPKRQPIADIEHWACQVSEQHWLKFRVVEGEMRAAKQPWPAGMAQLNTMQRWGWIERPEALE